MTFQKAGTQNESYLFLPDSFLKGKSPTTMRYRETWIFKINDGMNPCQDLNALIFSKVLDIQN